MRIGAPDLQSLGIVDQVIPEPPGAAHTAPEECIARVRQAVVGHLADLISHTPERLVEERYAKYRHMGTFAEGVPHEV
jgi:acetyl-CoA carboxylase carboxyl transferase subunit alpha